MRFASHSPDSPRPRPHPRPPWGVLLLAMALLVATGCRRHGAANGAALAQVRGRVLSVNGRVVPGARATLERHTGGQAVVLASSALGWKGDFILDRVPAGSYLLRTEAPGYATVTVPVELAPGDRLNTSLRFEPEQLLEGTVQDSRGQALPDALVLAWPTGKRQGPLSEAHSDRDGRFTVAGLPRGSWTLLVESPGFGALQLDRVQIPSRNVVL